MFCATCGAETEASPCVRCGADPLLDGRFRLEGILGQGAHGTTWRATDGEGPAVAIKELPLRLGAPAKLVQLFEREADVLQQLTHPGIPDYLDHFVRGHGRQRAMYLVMRFVEGQSLEVRLRGHRFDEREVLGVMDGVLEVLEYLHDRSPPVIHRDIKPANVLLEGDRLVLIDFGSVRDALRDEDLGGSTVAGTFGYMAPEQFAGDATPATDLYGLGALAVALLTRTQPQALQDRQQHIRWRHLANVSEAAADLIDRLLSMEPADRPASAGAARAEVWRVLSGEAAPRPAPGPVDPPSDPIDPSGRAAIPAMFPAMPAAAPAATPTAAADEALPALFQAKTGKRISLTLEAVGAVTDDNLGSLITSIEHITGLQGTVDHLGSTVRWHSRMVQGGRSLKITLEPHAGGTRVLISEDLTSLNGALYGGLGGGLGGGIGGGLGWAPFVFIGPAAGAAFLAAVAVGTVALILGLKRRIAGKRTAELQQVAATLQQLLGGSAAPPQPALTAESTDERLEARRLRAQAAKQREH